MAMGEKCIVTTYEKEELILIIRHAFAEELKDLIKDYLDQKDEYLDRKEAARFLKISIRTIANYQSRGTIPFYQIGRSIYFKKSELVKLIEDNCIVRYKHTGSNKYT